MLVPRRLFHLRSLFTLLFHGGSFSPLCCDPALSVFASKCQGGCHAMMAALCDLGDWLGGSLVSALSFFACTLGVALCDLLAVDFCLFIYGPANMTHKLSSACAETILSYHNSLQ